MKIGICTSIKNIGIAQQMGFDYIESAVVEIASFRQEEFEEVANKVNSLDIECYAFNVLFPGTLPVVGNDVVEDDIKAYIKKAFKRLSMLGAKRVVFGSGASRKCLDGWDKEEAFNQLVKTAQIVGDAASKYDIKITIEPLNRGETNTINSLSEGLELVKAANHTSVKLLADFYHMRVENESMDKVLKAGENIKHTHIANGKGRFFPFNETEDCYREFIDSLKKINYTGGISIEGVSEDFEADAVKSLKFLRGLI